MPDGQPIKPDLKASGEKIESLLDGLAAAGPIARERAEALVRTVIDLYGAGLEEVLDALYEVGRLDEVACEALADNELVSGLLMVHGLHPFDAETRVERALDGLRPYLGSHGGDVELLGIDDSGVVQLRMLGSCDGCPSSAVTLELAVEGAVRAAAPEVTDIQVESPRADAGAVTLIEVEALRSRVCELTAPTLEAPMGRAVSV